MTVRAEGQEIPGWVSAITTMTDSEIENAVVLMDRGPGWDRIIVHDTLGNWVATMDPARVGEISSAIRRELSFHLRNLRDERRRELGVEM